MVIIPAALQKQSGEEICVALHRFAVQCPHDAGNADGEVGQVLEEEQHGLGLGGQSDAILDGALLARLGEAEGGALGVQTARGVPVRNIKTQK